MKRLLVPVLLAIGLHAAAAAGAKKPAAPAEDAFATATLPELRKALYIRGLACEDCHRQALETMARDHAKTPIDLELEALHEEEIKYRRLVEKFNVTKEEFLEQMNATLPLDPSRAERVWKAFQSQLASGGVRFLANGTLQFSMPPTHALAAVLPASVCDALEDAYAALRLRYLSLPLKNRRRLEARLDAFVESGTLYAVLAVLLLVMVADVAYGALGGGGGGGGGEQQQQQSKPTATATATATATPAKGRGGGRGSSSSSKKVD